MAHEITKVAWVLTVVGTMSVGCGSCDAPARNSSGTSVDAGVNIAGHGAQGGQGGQSGQDGQHLPPSTGGAGDGGHAGDAVLVAEDAGTALMDAGGEVPADDAGSVSVGLPEWTARDYLQCYCNDESTHELCLDYDGLDYAWQDMFCGEVCAPYLGLSAIGGGQEDPFCDAPMIGGPDRLVCRCADGHEASLCANLSCFAESQRENVCHPTCAQRGGTVETDCEDYDYDTCIPPGTTLATCGCENGDEVRVCTSHTCSEGTNAGEHCRYSCIDKGGTAVSSCLENEPSCM